MLNMPLNLNHPSIHTPSRGVKRFLL